MHLLVLYFGDYHVRNGVEIIGMALVCPIHLILLVCLSIFKMYIIFISRIVCDLKKAVSDISEGN